MASWFRWYHGCVSDPKLGVVARKCKQPKYLVIAVWAALLEMASQASDRGDVTGFEADDFAEALGADTEAVQAVFDSLREKGLIEADRVAAWAKRQFEGNDTTAASRQKRKRERDKKNVTESHGVTERDDRDSRNVTASETEQNQIQSRTESVAIATGAAAPMPEPDLALPACLDRSADLKTQLFGPCLDWLAKQSGKPQGQLRPMIGKWLKDWGDGPVLEVFMRAQRESPIDPVAWITAALEAGNAKRNDHRKPTAGQTARAGIAAALLTDV